MKINTHLATLPAGYLFAEIAQRVKEYSAAHPDQKVLRLGIGDVTRPLAPAIASAFSQAAAGMGTKEGFHGYAPDFGYEFLIGAILEKDYRARGIMLDQDEIFISDGAKTDTSAIQELFSPDARIAVTDPVYPVYVDSNAMAGRLGQYENGVWSNLVYLPVTAENGFVPPLPEERVDVIYLCYPNNPTGTVLKKPDLKRFVDWALENEALIVYDAAYKAFVTEENVPLSIFEIPGAERCAVECCSFSKTAGFTGTRCGYTVIPRTLVMDGVSLNRMWARRQATKLNGVSYPVQCAAAAVFTDEGQEQIKQDIRYYLNNGKLILDGLKARGIQAFGGVNAPYVWLKTPGGMSGWEFFDLLLRQAQVVGTPGEGFGPSGAGCFRLTAFNTLENTAEAMERILTVL